jgi:hypothetical protein
LFAVHVSRAAGKQASFLLEKATDEGLGIGLNLFQMILAAEAFGVNLINILRSRWPRGEPTALGDQLDSADRLVVAGGAVQLRFDRLPGELLRLEVRGIQVREKLFLPTWRCAGPPPRLWKPRKVSGD